MIRYITDIPGAPKAIGPYSPAVTAGGLVFISGQVPLNPETHKLIEGGIDAQAEQVMKNLKTILAHLKLDFSNVLKSTIFLTDLSNFKVVNEIYERWLQGGKPARATVQVAALPLGAQVEIEMIATTEK